MLGVFLKRLSLRSIRIPPGKKKKSVEQAAENVQKCAEYTGPVILKQDSGVCEQQTWVSKRPARLALDRWVGRTRAFTKIPGERSTSKKFYPAVNHETELLWNLSLNKYTNMKFEQLENTGEK